jgi:hypothetical protein
MGCMNSKRINTIKYDVMIEDEDKDYYINIDTKSIDEYHIDGVLSPDVKKFYLLFKKVDEEKLPLAISFEVSDENIRANQYQFLRLCPNKSLSEIGSVCVQFPEEELSNVYCCDVSPSFPYPVDVKAIVKLKTV